MERGSDKHGRLVDEELAQRTRGLEQGAPVEPRVQEHFEQEPAADGEPVPDARLSGGRSASALPEGEVEARSELARFLSPALFPATRTQLLADATGNGATDEVLGRLSRLPEGRPFEHVQEVWTALGGHTEQRF